jgi:hypothetical protein
MKDIENQGNDIQERLAALGQEFNPNKSFGLMGMLEAQNEQQSGQLQTSEPAESLAQPASAEPEVPQWIEPFQSSLRQMRNETKEQISRLESRITQASPSGGKSEEEEPLDPVSKEIYGLKQEQQRLRLNTAYERAKNALVSKKLASPDFDYTEDELRDVWTSQVGNNADYADSINWGIYFDQQALSRRTPKLEGRIKELESQLAKTQSTRNSANDLTSVPRSSRTTPAPQAESGSDFDEEVYRRATARMGKGRFQGFNRLLLEEQNRKLFTRAS